MKKYTNNEQTAKLIELGFKAPFLGNVIGAWYSEQKIKPAYSIGELIEILSKNGVGLRMIAFDGYDWIVDWDLTCSIHQTVAVELIDGLYDMIVKLKENTTEFVY